MTKELLRSERMVRLGIFFGIFAVMSLWEGVASRRERSVPRKRRWPSNVGAAVLDTVLGRIVAPTGAVGLALFAEERGWGLFNMVALPVWLELLLALFLLDLAIYLQHRLFHYVPVLWRVHRMHHADLDVDVTTGARFHPIEILLSLGIKFLTIVPLGAPPLAVLLFEIGLNATSMFNHSNVRVGPTIERLLRWLVVTPDMHRVHHSIIRRETDSNFGFNFPWWDRLFGTYRPQPQAGHQTMTLAIGQFRDSKELRFDRMLTQPLREDSDKRQSVKRANETKAS